MNDNITEFLDIYDPDSEIIDISTDGSVKRITIRKKLVEKWCPICGCRLHSKGTFTRHPSHQILQDGFTLELTVIGRRWFCPQPDCSYTETDEFKFLEKYKKTSKIIPLLIVFTLKDLNLSCVQVAGFYHVSDTFVHDTFMRYVDLKRKPLTKYICIDEVFINLSDKCKYALVIMDFATGDILDILETRRKYLTESYFLSIPKEERDNVEFLICDMYSPYINFTTAYFANAEPVTDSFHVLQWLLRLITIYYNNVKKRYIKRDAKRREEEYKKTGKFVKNPQPSTEVYLLNHGRWVLVMNPDNIEYIPAHYNAFLDRVLDTYQWEEAVLALDKNFRRIRELKNLYEDFNKNFVNDLDGARKELDRLIKIYSESEIPIFRDFANLLIQYHDYIVNSFTYASDCTDENHTAILRRLSNGPMEAFNNKPSLFRSSSHGVTNFEFFRNRILWSEWDDAPILANPKPLSDIKVDTGVKRGPYKKK